MKECANIKSDCWSKQEKKLTIEDIRKEIHIKKDSFFIDTVGNVYNNNADYLDDNFFHSKNEIKQMIAVQNIRAVNYYLNGYEEVNIKHNDNTGVYYYYFDKEIRIDYMFNWAVKKVLKYFFIKKEHAEKCLKILGEKVIKESLGIFEE